MKKNFITLNLLLFLFSPRDLQAQSEILIQHVNVIPMNSETVLTDYSVLIKSGMIAGLDKASKLKAKDATIIDGNGKYLIPGLFDMHAHFFNEQGALKNTCREELKLMLANGLTTVRIMAGHPNYLEAREKVRTKTWEGPDLLVASPQLVGRWPWPPDFKNFEIVDTKEKGMAAVKKFKAEGYDAIKLTFMISREVFDAIAETAKTEGIKLVGHVGPKVKLPAALAVMEQNEHMDEFLDMLLPDSSYNHGETVSDMNLWKKDAWETVPYLDENKIPALVGKVKASGIYVTPTNFFFISCFGSSFTDDVYKSRPDYKFIPAAILPERWHVKELNRKMHIPADALQRYVYLRKKLVFELWKGGVPLMAGSDSPEWFLVTGFSIHDELDMFVQAGLSAYGALQTATVNTANYLGLNKGVIEKGKQADLILLDKNPIDDIKATRSIHGLMKDGKWYDRQALDVLLKDAAVLGK